MTDKTFTFTIEQIKDIYHAGIRRGQEEATCFCSGSFVVGKQYDECVAAIYDIVNEDKDIFAKDRIDYGIVEEWFKEK